MDTTSGQVRFCAADLFGADVGGNACPMAAQYRCNVDFLTSPPASSLLTRKWWSIRAAASGWLNLRDCRLTARLWAVSRRRWALATRSENFGLFLVRSVHDLAEEVLLRDTIVGCRNGLR
jgi:hypothetical protein